MKRRAVIVTALAIAVGLAVAGTIPALAQAPATDPELTCPNHDSSNMPHDNMQEWMSSDQHAGIHEQMGTGDMIGMMGNGSTMGGAGMGGAGIGDSMMGDSMMGDSMMDDSMMGDSMMGGAMMGESMMGGAMMGTSGG
ncbi:MAG TPA: hypothetical protein VGC11_02495 [Acidimicrobiia bacterium]